MVLKVISLVLSMDYCTTYWLL